MLVEADLTRTNSVKHVRLQLQTRKHSSRMHTARLPTVRVLVATTRCQYQWKGGYQPPPPVTPTQPRYLTPRRTYTPQQNNRHRWKTLPSCYFIGGRWKMKEKVTILNLNIAIVGCQPRGLHVWKTRTVSVKDNVESWIRNYIIRDQVSPHQFSDFLARLRQRLMNK